MGGESKFIGRVAEPPSTGFPPPQHRLLTFGIAGESSTRDGQSFVPLIGTEDVVPARSFVGYGDSTTRHGRSLTPLIGTRDSSTTMQGGAGESSTMM